jgi:hypothetical protein
LLKAELFPAHVKKSLGAEQICAQRLFYACLKHVRILLQDHLKGAAHDHFP